MKEATISGVNLLGVKIGVLPLQLKERIGNIWRWIIGSAADDDVKVRVGFHDVQEGLWSYLCYNSR